MSDIHRKVYDVVIVGAGVMGSSTAYFLTHQTTPKLEVLLLEQFDFLHRRGSSHGDSRIIRKSYVQDHYTEMMGPAYRLWAQIEAESGQKVFTKTGGLDFGKESNPYMQSILRGGRKYGVEMEVLSASELQKTFPTISVPEGWIGIYSPSSGILNATKAVSVLQQLAQQGGCSLRDNVKVVRVEKTRLHYEVTTSHGEIFKTRKVVFTTGAWTEKILKGRTGLLGPEVNLPLKVEQITVAYWKVEDSLKPFYSSERFPIFISYEDPNIYGFPSHEFPGLIKSAIHHGKVVDPDERDFEPATKAIEEKLVPFLQTVFKGVSNHPTKTESCLYTWTPDTDFIVDTIPGHEGDVFIGCGFSGHGFKLGPVIGHLVSEMVTNGGQSPSYSRLTKFFSLKRFQRPKNGEGTNVSSKL